jgi:tetratricopeptide (TPR) repeat protein
MFASDEETAELHRQATAFGDAKNWDKAVECLRRANERMVYSPVSYPILSWLRLPLYLQKAGRLAESMQVFDELDAATPTRVSRLDRSGDKAFLRRLTAYERGVIKKKRYLAIKRENLSALKSQAAIKGGL